MNTLLEENYLNYPSAVKEAMGINVGTPSIKPVPPVPPGPVGPADNEIWYWGEYYDMQAAIDYVSNSDYGWNEPYIGPKLLSNEFDGEKWILTFDGPVTNIGDIEGDEDRFYSYPMFITEYDEKEQEHSIECNVTSVILPDSVTEIQYGFQSCDNLTAVDLGNSIVSIGDGAFYGCSGLTSVSIPNSVTSIGHNAFAYCSGLTDINIPNSVTSIENDAFEGCTGLTAVVWNAKNCADLSSSSACFPNSVTSFTIGKEVERIPAYLCSNLSLTSVTIPNSVTNIGDWAFSDCSGLTSMTIPNSVTSIGERAFSGCIGLNSVTIGNGITSIGSAAFMYCDGLTSVTCEATTPPTLGDPFVFNDTNDCPIYVPAESVDAYKTSFMGWSAYADRIQAIP